MTVATKEAVIQVRVNARVKKDAQKALREMGLDVSTAVNMFLHQIIITQTIPFIISTKEGITPKQEREYAMFTKHARVQAHEYKNGKTIFS